MLQPIILQALGGPQALHAGAAVGPSGVVAFCGPRGAGKSTLALALQHAGWQQFSDDVLLWKFNKGSVTACPLPFAPRLRPDSRAHFADLAEAAQQPPCSSLPLAAVFLLKQDGALHNPRISLVRGVDALSKLLPQAYYFDGNDPIHMRRLLEDYLELLARAPVFLLEYQPDFRSLSKLTRAVMDAVVGYSSDIDSLKQAV
jgi:energy-coupling factor transporter ATP-binding protein EcfA2